MFHFCESCSIIGTNLLLDELYFLIPFASCIRCSALHGNQAWLRYPLRWLVPVWEEFLFSCFVSMEYVSNFTSTSTNRLCIAYYFFYLSLSSLGVSPSRSATWVGASVSVLSAWTDCTYIVWKLSLPLCIRGKFHGILVTHIVSNRQFIHYLYKFSDVYSKTWSAIEALYVSRSMILYTYRILSGFCVQLAPEIYYHVLSKSLFMLISKISCDHPLCLLLMLHIVRASSLEL